MKTFLNSGTHLINYKISILINEVQKFDLYKNIKQASIAE